MPESNPEIQIEFPQFKSLESDFSAERIHQYAGQPVLIKYGGNAMREENLKDDVLAAVTLLRQHGLRPVIVHGGGPAIQTLLDDAKIPSEFIGGHRKTTAESMRYVEMALRGEVNGDLVKRLNGFGAQAVGLSGKDAQLAIAKKRLYLEEQDGEQREHDLGQVGDVDTMNPQIVLDLLEGNYLPVVAPVASGPDGLDYNINADMFAGHLAGALNVREFILLTDVDGLCHDKDQPETLIEDLPADAVEAMMGSTIQGGMIPKIESCLIALRHGCRGARILNGTQPKQLLTALLTEAGGGTYIHH